MVWVLVRRLSATYVAESRFQPAFVSQAISRDSCSFLAASKPEQENSARLYPNQ